MELKGKKVMVLGLGRTGLETARFLARQGAEVALSDRRGEQELKGEMTKLSGLGIRFLLGGEEVGWMDGVETLVLSPGVPSDNPLVRQASGRGIEVISEIELAHRFLTVPLAAITGTNGKTTTTSLVGAMLKKSGTSAFVGGNIGDPLIGFVSGQWDWGVVEVSSFQLDWVEQFRPRIAALLNLTEDHLDRYRNFASYCEAKSRIFRAQGEGDTAVVNRDDPLVWSLRDRIGARVVSFGQTEVQEGIFAAGHEMVWRDRGNEHRFDFSRVRIQGPHNVENLMAAIVVGESMGIPKEAIQQAIEEFPGLEHRLEFVCEKEGVRFYNDSKATNVGAVLKSLASFPGPVVLIAGGLDKGGNYQVLADEVKGKVKRLILLGAASELLQKALGDLCDTDIVENIGVAVRAAFESAEPGDVVLLSPACSSFDMFHDYAQRGRIFKTMVQTL